MELEKAKKNKNQETDVYETDKRPRTEKLKLEEITLTEKLEKKLKQKKSRNAYTAFRVGQKRGHFLLQLVTYIKILIRSAPNVAQINVISFPTLIRNLFETTSENI